MVKCSIAIEQEGVKMVRIEKVNQQIKREIGRILQQEMGDPRLQFVTITKVDVSRDLRNAKILFSVLGAAAQRHAAQQGLEGARGMIRKLLGENINIRFTPELFFVYDNSIELNARIEETLKEIRDEHDEDPSDNQDE
jgi:ribosome-binding factor A